MLKKLVGACALFLAFSVSVHAEEPKKIAFVDTGNTGRSVSAEALTNVLIKQRNVKVAVISRAVDMDPFDVQPEANAVKLLRERGIDVSNHLSAQVTINDVHHADVILTMTTKHKDKLVALFPEAKDKTFTISEYATGSYAEVADAWGKPMDVYVAMIRQLDTYLPQVLDKLAPKSN